MAEEIIFRQVGNELKEVIINKQKIMKLKSYNEKNSRLTKEGECFMRINLNAGLFSFSRRACTVLGIEDHDRIEIHQDEENPKDWYVEIASEGNGFPVRRKDNDKKGNATFNCSHIAHQIFNSIELEDQKSAGFNISETPVEFEGRKLFLIITSSVNTVTKNLLNGNTPK